MDERLINALCSNYGYQPLISEPEVHANPETKEQFAQRMMDTFISENIKRYELGIIKEKAETEYLKAPEETFARAIAVDQQSR